jgi:hypothetical protein
MLPFGVTIPASEPQRSEFPKGLMNYHVTDQAEQLGYSGNENKDSAKMNIKKIVNNIAKAKV